LLLLTVVRPVLRNLINASQAKADSRDASVVLINERAEAMRNSPLMVEANTPTILGELNPLSEIRLPAPGSGLELQMEHLQMLAQNDPERVSEVIKQWIGRNERSLNPA
jgi:flagellar M-ring protein FliF